MMRLRECRHCGKTYKAERKLYCSDDCRTKWNREYQARWSRNKRAENPGLVAKNVREWRKRNPDKVAKWKWASWATIKNDPYRRELKRLADARLYAKKRPPLRTVQCDACSNLFETRRDKQKYCCVPCQRQVLADRDKVRRHLGISAYYNSERRREYVKQYREEHREDFRRWDRERRERALINPKGEFQWLRKCRHELGKIKRLLSGGKGGEKSGRNLPSEKSQHQPSPSPSASPKKGSTPRNNSPP